jgi:hypothetical protein
MWGIVMTLRVSSLSVVVFANRHIHFNCLLWHHGTKCGWLAMMFNATFNNISVWWRRSVLLVEETRAPGENHWPAASHWQTLSYYVVSSTPPHVIYLWVWFACGEVYLLIWWSLSVTVNRSLVLTMYSSFLHQIKPVLLVEETRAPGENHWPAASHWQTLSYYVVSSTPPHEQDSNSQR